MKYYKLLWWREYMKEGRAEIGRDGEKDTVFSPLLIHCGLKSLQTLLC
jgi:hypothetical protein